MNIKELVDAEATHAELHQDDEAPAGVKPTQPNRAKSVMLSLRLSQEEAAEIKRIADFLDVPVSAFVRGLIVQRLAAERGDVNARSEEFATALRALQRFAVLDGLDQLPSIVFADDYRSRQGTVIEEINA